MSNKDYEIFQACWTKFSTRLKGEMMMQAKNKTFTYPVLNLLLAESTGFWDSQYSEGGRWLKQYEKEEPGKADMIRDILVKDMKFTEVPEAASRNDFLKYALPAGSAVAGFAISRIFSASKLIQAICTIATAAAAYPIAGNILDKSQNNKRQELIQAYMSQLDKYKISVESIMQSV